ncbi:MAG: GAP family protein [Bacillota bacterium]
METIFIKIMPLILAAAVSPADFVVLIKILAGAHHQRRNALAFILGSSLMYLLVAIATMLVFEHQLGHPPVVRQPHNLDHALVNFTLAGLAVVLFIRMLLKNDSEQPEPNAKAADGPLKCFFIGMGMKVLSLNAMLPFIAAVHEVSESGLGVDDRMVVFALGIGIAVLPMLLPYVGFVLNKRLALKIVVPIGNFIDKHKNQVVKVMLPIVAVLLCYHGLVHLGLLK